jgi:divalent metal cation (Fe/Co/Zn/Cd) transporter
VNHKVYWLQGATIAWMVAECIVAIYSAIESHSVSILAFGSDSVVELLSAFVALIAFIPQFHISEERTAKWSGILLILLCIMIVCEAILSLMRRGKAVESWSGIVITALALVVMPILAWWKRNIARETGNRALAADAVQSATCAYLAAVTLCGLALSSLFQIRWTDPIAALIAVPVVLYEARRALRGESCGCGPSSDLCSPSSRSG